MISAGVFIQRDRAVQLPEASKRPPERDLGGIRHQPILFGRTVVRVHDTFFTAGAWWCISGSNPGYGQFFSVGEDR
jgi:hypothetical protein